MINQLRKQLALPQTSVQLCLLGFFCGLISAGVIILFRLGIHGIQHLITSEYDDFTNLDNLERFVFPIIAALLIAIFGAFTGFRHQRMGVPLVIHWMKTNYGKVPFRNTLNQFVGGILALGSGFSVGKEGPAVHLGAAASSMMGARLNLPDNSVKTLSACGIAAAISACFNTPLAAVIFVMEVVLRDYKIHVFIPIILASVAGNMFTHAVFGDDTEFSALTFQFLAVEHVPFLILFGLVSGVMAALFKRQLIFTLKQAQPISMFPRLMLAGLITAIIGYLVPQSLGSGMAAVNFILEDAGNLQLLLFLFMAKWLATQFAIGLGIPGGIIGPLIGLGSVLGAIFAFLPATIIGGDPSTGSYVIIGMAALMGATLHAPLAAIVSIMELTISPDLAMDGMLVVVVAYVTSKQILNRSSLFLMQLDFQNLSYRVAPVTDVLQRVGIIAELNTDFKVVNAEAIQHRDDNLQQALLSHTHVIVDNGEGQFETASIALDRGDAASLSLTPIAGVHANATLAEAYEILSSERQGAVYIYDDSPTSPIGVVSWASVRRHLVEGSEVK